MKVSVVIPAYNAEMFVEQAVLSVLSQTLSDFEVLLIDDCSTDGTYALLKKLVKSDKRITALQTAQNLGPSGARNKGIDHATGAWVAILDADDVYKNDRLEKMVAYAEKHDLDMLADNIIYYDLAADCETTSNMSQKTKSLPFDAASLARYDTPYVKSPNYGLLKPIFKRSFLEAHKLRYVLDYRYGEDFLFCAEILLCGAKAKILTAAWYVYTARVGVISGEKSMRSRTEISYKQLVLATENLLSKYADTMPLRIKKAFLKRQRIIKSNAVFLVGKKMLKEHRYVKATFFFLRHPATWKCLLISLVRMPAKLLDMHFSARKGVFK